MSSHDLIANFFLAGNTTLSTFTYYRTSRWLPSFGYYKSMLSFVRNCQSVFRSGWTILTPKSNEWSFRSFTFLPAFGVSVFHILAFLIGMQRYLLVVICNSLITHNVGYLSICWFAIYIFSLMRCLLSSLAFKFFFFLLLGFKSSLHILDDSLLSDMSFAHSFSRSMACFLTLATVCCKVEAFNVNSMLSHSVVSDSLWQVQFIIFFFFIGSCLGLP